MLSLFYLFLLVTKMDNDASFTRREGEEEMFAFIRQPVEGADDRRSENDGSQFLNDSGQGMETERRDKRVRRGLGIWWTPAVWRGILICSISLLSRSNN